MNYYNEIDPYCVQWLRNLISAGEIPDGLVDDRSIVEVTADDLRGFTQVHFFAGIGGWSHALKLAGWPNYRPIWTGSCPCQPFSAAGKGKGKEDERHLWPEMFRLVRECRPELVVGEQVASAIGHGWLDGVSADLEGKNYAVGAVVLGAHSVGAPHIRQRLYWVADARWIGRRRWGNGHYVGEGERGDTEAETTGPGASSGLADAQRGAAESRGHHLAGEAGSPESAAQEWQRLRDDVRAGGNACGVADTQRHPGGPGWIAVEPGEGAGATGAGAYAELGRCGNASGLGNAQRTGLPGEPLGLFGASGQNYWSDFDLLPCLDGKARRVEPGTFPLANGVPARVGKLRAYGNAICPQTAAAFLEAVSYRGGQLRERVMARAAYGGMFRIESASVPGYCVGATVAEVLAALGVEP